MKNLKYFLSIIPFVCFFVGYNMSNLFIRANSYKTPHIIGLSVHEALRITSQNHANIKLITEQECQGMTPGTIMTQKPASGRLMKPNQTILVTISKQPDQKKAPNFKLKTHDSITKICKQDSLKIKERPQVYPLPQGTCISQIPQPDTSITNKKIIIYTAQDKPNLYIMPNFTGKDLSSTALSLQNHQISFSVLRRHQKIHPPFLDDYTVTDQKPRAGSFISLEPTLTIQLEVQ